MTFAAGQALSPIVALQLFTIHASLPWLSMFVMEACVLLCYPLLGVSLWREPEWRLAMLEQAKQKQQAAQKSTPKEVTAAEA